MGKCQIHGKLIFPNILTYISQLATQYEWENNIHGNQSPPTRDFNGMPRLTASLPVVLTMVEPRYHPLHAGE